VLYEITAGLRPKLHPRMSAFDVIVLSSPDIKERYLAVAHLKYTIVTVVLSAS